MTTGGAHKFIKVNKNRATCLRRFLTKLLRSDTLQDFFVVVRSFTAERSLLQPTGVWTTHLTRHNFSCLHIEWHAHAWLKAQVVSLACAHHIPCVISMRSCCVFDSLRLLHVLRCSLSSLLSTCLSSWPSTSSSTMWWSNSLFISADEDLGTLAEYDPLTGYQPNGYRISETTELFIQELSGENRSLNSHDFEYDDYTIGIALSSPLFTQEREDAASRRQAYHSPDEGLSSSQSSSVGHRTGRLVGEQFDLLISDVRENPRRGSEREQIRILLQRQREQILADFQAEIQRHEFQADYDRRSIQKLNEMIESQEEEICRAHQGDERCRNIRHDYDKKIVRRPRYYPWTHWQDSGFTEWKQLYEWFERFFKMLNQYAVDKSHFTSQPVFFPKHPDPGGLLSRSPGSPSRKNGSPSFWDRHGISGNVFASRTASSSAPFPQEWNSMDFKCIITHVTTCDEWKPNTSSGSDMPVLWGTMTNSVTQRRSLVGSQDSRLRYVLVHNVDSVDDLMSSSTTRGIQNAKFWSTRCEDRFSTAQNHP